MSKIQIEQLLEKYRKGTITSEELVMLESWYLQWQPEKAVISIDDLEAAKNEAWNSMNIGGLKKSYNRFYVAAAVAASVLLIFWFGYFSIQDKAEIAKEPFVAKVQKDFLPGDNKAILTLSNGKQIVLKDAPKGKLAEEGNMQVKKTAAGKIIYDLASSENGKPEGIIYNKMTTPRGGQFHVVLSDGTNVWLNAASSITYPVVFKGKERNVKITGEAYFEVAHNAKMPFKVSSANQEITVLGTHFNISSYPDDGQSITALISGKVQVRNTQSGALRLLSPGQGAIILSEKGEIDVNIVNIEQVLAWRNGYFIFDNQDIKSIMKILSRWYDVDIEYNNENIDERFGGTFSRSRNLTEILKNIEQLSKLRFKLYDGRLIVSN